MYVEIHTVRVVQCMSEIDGCKFIFFAESGQLERVTREVDEAGLLTLYIGTMCVYTSVWWLVLLIDRDLRERQVDLSRKMENLHSAMSVFTHKK